METVKAAETVRRTVSELVAALNATPLAKALYVQAMDGIEEVLRERYGLRRPLSDEATVAWFAALATAHMMMELYPSRSPEDALEIALILGVGPRSEEVHDGNGGGRS